MTQRLLLRAALPFAPPLWSPPFEPGFFDRLRPPLHDFQLDLLIRLVVAIGQGYTRILLQLPTGGGKTHLAKALLGGADLAQFIVHRKELIEQTSKAFTLSGIGHGFVASDRPMDLNQAVLLCGIATLAKRLGVVLPPNLAVWDECHHLGAATWIDVMSAYPEDTIHVGLTATPERLDGQGLGRAFQIMLRGPTTAELIRRGFLSPFDYYAPSLPDMTGVTTEGQAEAVMDRPELIGDMVEHYLRLAAGQPGIVFAHSIEHSRHLVEAYRAAGVRAAHIDGEMSTKERERVDGMFRDREIDILSNCALLGEGYDVPGVVYVGLGRRTQSVSLFLQMAGRALRTAPGKDRAVICDHAANAFTHGLPDDDREWSLEGRSARARTGVNDDADPVRQCMECFRVYPSTAKVCPGCGATQSTTPREIKQREGELQKLERETLRAEQEAAKKAAAAARKAEEKACASEADFRELAVRRGYDNPRAWAARQVGMRAQYAQRFRR
jgi:superfamily II DNA or RNA helicase